MRRSLARVAPLVLLCLAPAVARAQELQVKFVSAPQINCVFSPSCSVTVSDFSAPFWGKGFLQSRVIQGAPGSPAEGMWVYLYRVDLAQAAIPGAPSIPNVQAVEIDIGPVVNTLDFDGDGVAGEQVFAITQGGMGVMPPHKAVREGRVITFHLWPGVVAGHDGGAGSSTTFFGVVSRAGPRSVTATLRAPSAGDVVVEARAPSVLTGRPVPPRPTRPVPTVRPPSSRP
jgi:hypothetical protein